MVLFNLRESKGITKTVETFSIFSLQMLSKIVYLEKRFGKQRFQNPH